MSDLNIRLNLDSTAAAAAAAEVHGDLNKLKTDAEKPIKINVDSSQLAGATAGTGKLQEALGNVQAAALGELSQKAAQLGASLGGVAGSLAEVAIKSAAAFGPVGIAITAVLAGLALLKQAYDEDVAETERVDAVNRTVASSGEQLGGAYGSIADAANRAKTAEEARNLVGQRTSQILAEQLNLLSSGGTVATAQGLSLNFENISRASVDASTGVARYTTEQVKNIALTGNAQQQMLLFGTTMEHSTNAIDNQTRALIVSSTAIVQRITLENQNRQMGLVVAEALRAAEQRKSTADESSAETAERLAAADLEVQIAGDLATASANNLFVANTRLAGATADLAEHTVHLTDAEKNIANQRQANEILEARKHAHATASVAESALQRRMGEEALRLAEQAYSQGDRTLTQFEQQAHAMQALSFAEQELTRARTASESHGQTAAERTQLITALNNEATARLAVANATQQQADRLGTLMERATSRTDPVADNEAENLRFQQSLTRIQQEQRIADGASKAQDAARAHTLQQQSTFTGRMNTLMGQQKGTTEQLAGSAKNALGAIGTAMASHAQAMIQGKEDIGDALQGMLKDVLSSIGSEAMIKGAMMMAEGAAALAGIYTAPLAAGNFAAGAAFFAVGAAASAAGAAIPAAASASTTTGGGGAATASSATTSETPNRSGGNGATAAPSNITINMNAFQSNDQAQSLIVRALREAGYRNIR